MPGAFETGLNASAVRWDLFKDHVERVSGDVGKTRVDIILYIKQ